MTFPWNGFPAGLFRGFFFTNPPFFRVLSPVAPAWAGAGIVIQSEERLKQQTRKRAVPGTRSAALVERQVPMPVLPPVDLVKPVELGLLQLFQPMCQPPS